MRKGKINKPNLKLQDEVQLIQKSLLVIIQAKNLESALSGNAATLKAILQSYVDTIVISLDSSPSKSKMQVIWFCNIKMMYRVIGHISNLKI